MSWIRANSRVDVGIDAATARRISIFANVRPYKLPVARIVNESIRSESMFRKGIIIKVNKGWVSRESCLNISKMSRQKQPIRHRYMDEMDWI